MEKEERLRQQAPHYLPCFINDCPHHESCLHWLTGQYGEETDDATIICVNPHNREVKTGNCCYYRENKVVTYAVGMMHLLDNIPHAQARVIKSRLIDLFSRTRFYQYRNGTRPIPPEDMQLIADICKEEGWTGEIRYDGFEEDYLW